jgi:hypothetical protein
VTTHPTIPTPATRAGVGLDRRLVRAGLAVTVRVLVAVFADHHPGQPPASTCPGCGYRYPDGATDCPSAAVVRPLLYRRRTENQHALDVLTAVQFADLHHPTRQRASAWQAARPASAPVRTLLDLITGEDQTP